MRPRHGRGGVADFFAYVATMQIQDFQVLDMLASDRQVVVEVQISIAMADGSSLTDEELHFVLTRRRGPDHPYAPLRRHGEADQGLRAGIVSVPVATAPGNELADSTC
jgi:hypothetical protein